MVQTKPGMLKNMMYTVGMRWLDRAIGVLSTLILARLLLPEDFGLVAMTSLVISFVDVFFDLGVNVALIQNSAVTKPHYDTAWSLRLIQCCFAALFVNILAPFAADYFNKIEVSTVLHVLSLAFVLNGVENIGIVSFQKELRFAEEFRFLFLKRFGSFLATITLAFLLHSYWALIFGMLFGRCVGVVLSYCMHPMRPSFSLSRAKDIFSVSQWMIFRSIGGYFENNFHKIIVGGRSSSALMGAYSLADEIAAMPSAELLGPINRVLFPAFVNAKGNVNELKRIFLLALSVQAALAFPAGIGLCLVSHELVLLLLGEKWATVEQFLSVLALLNIVTAMNASVGYLLITVGRIREMALYAWVQFALMILSVVLIFPGALAIHIAWIRLINSMVGFLLFGFVLVSALPNIGARDVASCVYRSFIAAIVMAVALFVLGRAVPSFGGVLFALLAKIFLGAVVYVFTIIIIWIFVGKPVGAESFFLDRLHWVRRLLLRIS